MTNELLAKALRRFSEVSSQSRVEILKTSPYAEELFAGYYFAAYIKCPFAPFHFEMFQDWRDLNSGKIRELAWFCFRESAKTSIAKMLMTKSICLKERGYVNIDSLDIKNSETFLFDIAQNLLTNRRIIQDFGFIYEKKRVSDEMTMTRLGKFLTRNGILVEAHSVAEAVRGRIHKAQRPDLVILDDFESNKTKDSQAYTSITKGHIEEFSTGLDSKAAVLYLGNYISKTGVVQWILDRAKKDERIRIRMVPIEENGKPTWEDKYCMTDKEAKETGKISLEDKKRQFDFVVYQTEMMNNPIGGEQQIFKKEMFKPISYDEVMKMNCRVFMTIDTAISQKSSADYTGIVINFVDREGFWNIMTFKRKMTPKELLDFIFEYWEKYKIEEIGIEKTTFQMALKEFFEEEMRKRGKFPRIVDLLHRQQKKEERIRGALLGRYESGSIRHIENYCEGLEDELLAFPIGSNDDVVDSCFKGDTPVLTEFGYKKIQDIKSGDRVVTPTGLQRVLWAGNTGYKKVINKFGLFATPDHKIFNGKSFDKLDTIPYHNHISKFSLRNQIIWKYKSLLHSMEKPTASWEGKESIISVNQQQIKDEKILRDFTLRFGNFITKKKFLKAIVFTIKTVIAIITTLKIWSVCHVGNTCLHILRKDLKRIKIGLESSTKEVSKQQKYGINLKRVGNGTKNTGIIASEKSRKNSLTALSVVKSFLANIIIHCFALVIAPVKIEGNQEKMMKKEYAPTVQKNLPLINTSKIDSATEVVVPVFNITVENDNCYYANGILVANCAYQDQIAKSAFSQIKTEVKTQKPFNCG